MLFLVGTTVGATVLAAQAPKIKIFQPSSRLGQYEAEKSGNRLTITLRVHYLFLEGDRNLVPGYGDDEYSWTSKEQADFKAELERRVKEAWSHRYVFESGSGADNVQVEVKVQEVSLPDGPHWLIKVRHYPEDAPDTEANTSAPGKDTFGMACDEIEERNKEGYKWGVVNLASTHLQPEHVRALEIAPVDVWFSANDDELPADFLRRPSVRLFSDLGWSARLTGYAGIDEVAWPTGKAHPSVELARRRTAKVRQALLDLACRSPDCEKKAKKRIREINRGGFGEAPYDDRQLVRIELHRRPSMDTLTHEAGHMLGLDDEASTDTRTVDGPVRSPDYAAMVAWYQTEPVLTSDDDGIMSRGDKVRPWHYVTFQEVLEVLTCAYDWSIHDP